MTRISKRKAIELILIEMESGNIDAPVILEKLGKTWAISKSSFYNYYNEASATHADRQKVIQNELLKDSTIAAKERLKKVILTKDERMEIASKIAKGEAWKVKNELIIPSAGDRLRALDYLSKVDGDYAPNKMEITAPEPITFTILRRDEQ